MSLFSGMTSEGLEEAEDRLGGFQIFPTDIYNSTIKMAYAMQSAGGARGINFEFDIGNGRSYRETVWYTNRNGENWFIPQGSTKKSPLPGFTLVDHICLLTTDAPLAVQDAEEKVIKVYDPEAKKELPKSVPVLTGLLNKPISLAIVKSLTNKNEKTSDGKYVPTAETREENHIEKAFHTATKLTVVEAQQDKTEGEFWDKWLDKNKDQVRDKRKQVGNAPGGPGRATNGPPQPSANQNGAAPRKSLFGAR